MRKVKKEKNIGKHIVAEINQLLNANKVIVFGSNLPENDYSEIRWSQYGLIETNEVAVMVKCGIKAFAAKSRSALQMPPMADRVFGMDVLDEELAFKLANNIWESFSEELIREAKLIRKKRKNK